MSLTHSAPPSSQLPALLDFLPLLLIDAAGDPEAEGIIPGPIYPLSGIVAGALAVAGGMKGVRLFVLLSRIDRALRAADCGC